jgi:hypothetical protein
MAVRALALLWVTATIPFLAGSFLVARSLGLAGGERMAAIFAGCILALLSLVLAAGTWVGVRSARTLQLLIGGVGLFTCAFTAASILLITVLMQAPARVHFSGRRRIRELAPEEEEALAHPWMDTATAAGLLLFGLAGQAAVIGWFVWPRG